jgi:hypothetical protein
VAMAAASFISAFDFPEFPMLTALPTLTLKA